MNKSQKANDEKHVSEEEIKNFILEKFEGVKESNEPKSIIEFHTRNKYMIMAHDQIILKTLGNIVANHANKDLKDTIEEYEKYLIDALNKEPTIKTHSNVLLHIFGFFSTDLNKFEKIQFLNLWRQFKERKISIGNILSEINPIISQFNKTYLAGQTYFLLYADVQSANLFETHQKQKVTE